MRDLRRRDQVIELKCDFHVIFLHERADMVLKIDQTGSDCGVQDF